VFSSEISAEWSGHYFNPSHILGNVALKIAQACMAVTTGSFSNVVRSGQT
jgi:hypothetical protein